MVDSHHGPANLLLAGQSHFLPDVPRPAKSWKCPVVLYERRNKIALNLCAQSKCHARCAPNVRSSTRFRNFRSISRENCIAGHHHHGRA